MNKIKMAVGQVWIDWAGDKVEVMLIHGDQVSVLDGGELDSIDASSLHALVKHQNGADISVEYDYFEKGNARAEEEDQWWDKDDAVWRTTCWGTHVSSNFYRRKKVKPLLVEGKQVPPEIKSLDDDYEYRWGVGCPGFKDGKWSVNDHGIFSDEWACGSDTSTTLYRRKKVKVMDTTIPPEIVLPDGRRLLVRTSVVGVDCDCLVTVDIEAYLVPE